MRDLRMERVTALPATRRARSIRAAAAVASDRERDRHYARRAGSHSV